MTTRKIIDVLGISAPTDTGRWRATQESMMRARYRRGEINPVLWRKRHKRCPLSVRTCAVHSRKE